MEIVGPITTSRRSLLKMAGSVAAWFALSHWAFQTRLERMKAFAEAMGIA